MNDGKTDDEEILKFNKEMQEKMSKNDKKILTTYIKKYKMKK